MSLFATLLAKKLTREVATVTNATDATHEWALAPTVARGAIVAVANTEDQHLVVAIIPSEIRLELFEERAAIMELDGGLDRCQAVLLALLHTDYVLHHWACRTCFAAGIRRGQRCNLGAKLWTKYEAVVTTKPSLSANDSQLPPSSP